MDDTIYRWAAIDEICDIRCGKSKFDCESYKNRNYISDCDYIRSLLNLPSTQPEIVRCKDCKRFDVNGWCNYLETAMKPNDYCSRVKRREG